MLTQIADNVWGVEQGFSMPGGITLPLRMTVIRLEDGSLLLHGPFRIDDELAGALNELGPVRHLLGPNCFHYGYINDAMARYPEACSYAAPGLDKKRRDISFGTTLTDQVPDAWAGDLDLHIVGGAPLLGEVVLRHKASHTLIVCDLVFHVLEPQGWRLKMMTSMMGTRARFAQSRLVRLAIRDRKAAKRSLLPVFEQPFERVVMSHGDVLEVPDATDVMRDACRWILK